MAGTGKKRVDDGLRHIYIAWYVAPHATFSPCAYVQMPREFGPEFIALPPSVHRQHSMNLPRVCTSAITTSVDMPLSIKSSATGPYFGPVTFCDAPVASPERA